MRIDTLSMYDLNIYIKLTHELDYALISSATDCPFSKLIRHLVKCQPFNALMCIYPINEPLVHRHDMRSSRDLWMNADREDEGVVFSVAPCKHILPPPLDTVRVDKALL